MTLREALDAEARAKRLLQSCPPAKRHFLAQQYQKARRARLVAEAMAALQPVELTEHEKRIAAIEARMKREAA
jgi:hypothetical protein